MADLHGIRGSVLPEWWSELPDLPDDYGWQLLPMSARPAVELVSNGFSLGRFDRAYDAPNDKYIWRVVRNFRVQHFDTIEEAVNVQMAKHRLGALGNEKRDVF